MDHRPEKPLTKRYSGSGSLWVPPHDRKPGRRRLLPLAQPLPVEVEGGASLRRSQSVRALTRQAAGGRFNSGPVPGRRGPPLEWKSSPPLHTSNPVSAALNRRGLCVHCRVETSKPDRIKCSRCQKDNYERQLCSWYLGRKTTTCTHEMFWKKIK